MNSTLIVILLIVLIISLMVAPGKAVAMAVVVPFAGGLIFLLVTAFRRWATFAEEKARQREWGEAQNQKALLEEEARRRVEESARKDAEVSENARLEIRARALAEASRKDRKRACLHYVTEHLLVDYLIIDSNIWMNDEYGSFFYVLEEACHGKNGYRIVLDGEQFNEICNFSKNSEFGAEINQRARLALERIQQFQTKGFLTIATIVHEEKLSANGASRVFLQIDAATKAGKRISLVTDDRDLRIQVRKYLYESENAKIGVVNIESIIQECREVQATDHSFLGAVRS